MIGQSTEHRLRTFEIVIYCLHMITSCDCFSFKQWVVMIHNDLSWFTIHKVRRAPVYRTRTPKWLPSTMMRCNEGTQASLLVLAFLLSMLEFYYEL